MHGEHTVIIVTLLGIGKLSQKVIELVHQLNLVGVETYQSVLPREVWAY